MKWSIIFWALIPLFSSFPAYPQNTFEKCYGGSNEDQSFSVIQTSDSGYIIAGFTRSFGASYSDAYLIKTDINGNILWYKLYGGWYEDDALSVKQTADGGFILAGGTWSFGSGAEDIYLIRTDENGNLIWDKTYGGSEIDVAMSVSQTGDSGFIIAGCTLSYGKGLSDVYLIRTDINGDTIWTKTYGGAEFDRGNFVIQTNEGGFIITGSTSSFGNSLEDIYIIRTDMNGDTLWTKIFGGTYNDYGSCILQTTEDRFVFTGTTVVQPNDCRVFLFMINNSGDSIWKQTFFKTGKDEGYSVASVNDGGYIITGSTYYARSGGFDVYLIKTDENGNLIWDRTFGGSGDEIGRSVIQSNDGGYVISGYTNSFGLGLNDVYVIKTDSSGNINGFNHYSLHESNGIVIFPNPATDVIYIKLEKIPDWEEAEINIASVSGEIICHSRKLTGEDLKSGIDISGLGSGVYTIQVRMNNVLTLKKIIIF
jgi:hypothetical protein